MSLQVGTSCYATAVDAGRAACSQFEPVSTISGSIVKTVSCSSSDPSTGALILDINSIDSSTNAASSVQVTQNISFPPCVQQDYIDAAEVIAGSLLAFWVVGYAGYKIMALLDWSRGESV